MKNIIILDGGMGRELHRRGAPFRQPEWSALALTESPESVQAVHADFIQAGAQVITTNSYAIVPFHIGETRFANEARQLADLSGKLAQQAVQECGAKVQIAASFPPLFGSYRPDLFDENRADELAQPLLDGLLLYADIVLAETVSSLQEAAFWYGKLQHSGKPIWLAFTLDDTKAHQQAVLRSGETVFQAAESVKNWAIDAILFNCSQPEIMEQAIVASKQVFQKNLNAKSPKIGVYANAFEPVQGEMNDANGELDSIRADNSPEHYLAWARTWVDAGAEIVGGCCGIAPEHIAVLARYFDAC